MKERKLQHLLAIVVSTLLFMSSTHICHAQAGVAVDRVAPRDRHPLTEQLVRARRSASDTTHSHRRATIVGAMSGAVIGGLGSAGYVLNATTPHCFTEVSLGSGCTHKTRRVVLQSVAIGAGTTVGAFIGVWVARRLAGWRDW
jgi:hypothetical protein